MAPRKKTPAELPDEESLLLKISEVRKTRADCEKRGNAWTTVGTMHDLESKLLRELRALRAPVAPSEAVDPTANLSDAEIVSALADALQALPISTLDDVLDRVGAERIVRDQQPTLTVIKGG